MKRSLQEGYWEKFSSLIKKSDMLGEEPLFLLLDAVVCVRDMAATLRP